MFLLIKIAILVGLVRLLDATENPLLCASIYAGAVSVLGLAGGATLLGFLLLIAIRLPLAFGYFWLMDRFESLSGAWWILVGVGGILVLLV